MNPMIPSLFGTKMSSSHPPNTKIMFLDDVKAVHDKVLEAPWPGIDATKNGVLALVKSVLIPVARLQAEQRSVSALHDTNGTHYTNGDTPSQTATDDSALFTVETSDKCMTFSSYEEVEQSLSDDLLQPDEIKIAVAQHVNALLDHVRRIYGRDEEWQTIDKVAYAEET